jgi:hypothetical protein
MNFLTPEWSQGTLIPSLCSSYLSFSPSFYLERANTHSYRHIHRPMFHLPLVGDRFFDHIPVFDIN